MVEEKGPAAEDAPIRSLFARLRQTDAAAAPRFDELLGRPARAAASRQRSRRRAVWALATAATAAVLLLVVLAVDRDRRRAPAPSITLCAWRSPTDYLLEPPAASLVRGMPSIGRVDEEVFSCDRCF